MPSPTTPVVPSSPDHPAQTAHDSPEPSGFDDPLYPQAAAMLPADEAMPVSFLQRRFHIGYHRAQRLKDAIRGTAADMDESPVSRE